MKCSSRMFAIVGLFALMVGILGSNAALAQDGKTGPRSRGSEATHKNGELGDRLCPLAGPPGEVEGDTFFCGVLYLPENYEEPEGRQIQITYAVLKAESLSPLPDPIVYLEGGPGGSAISRIAMYANIFADLRQTRDIVLLDQRGAKYSTRLDCAPHNLLFNYLLEVDDEANDQFDEILQATDETELGPLLSSIYMQSCASGLEEAGFDLTQYTSANAVNDLFMLTEALGYADVNLYGISYGTRMALTAMRDHPEGIRSVVLDSSYPPQAMSYEDTVLIDEVLTILVDTCKNDAECHEAFPDFGKQLGELLQRVADDEDAFALTVTILEMINRNPAIAEFIPLMVDQLDNGETEILLAIANGELPLVDAPEDLPGDGDDLLLQADELRERADALFNAAAQEAQNNRPGALWMNDLYDVTDEMSIEDRSLAAVAMMYVPEISPIPSKERLEKFITNYLPDEEQQGLIDSLTDLSDAEVQYIYDLIADASDVIGDSPGGFTDGMFMTYECNEEFPFTDAETARDVADTLTYPELAPWGLALFEQQAAICGLWPSSVADPIETEVIESDIPTLVLSGDYDVQTPPSWNEMAMEGLSDGTLVEFQASGHGVIRFSTCASNIATAFLVNPEGELNTGCTADLAPDFVTPDEFDDMDFQASTPGEDEEGEFVTD